MKQPRFLPYFCLLSFIVIWLLVGCGSAPDVTSQTVEVHPEMVVETRVVEASDSIRATTTEPMGGTVVEEVVVVTRILEVFPAGTMAAQPMVIATPPMFPQPPAPATPAAATFQDYGVNPYVQTSVDNLSTFSLDVDTGSFALSRRWLTDGYMPPPESVRVEEFVNYFDPGYAAPENAAFALYADGAPSPFHNDGTIFVRIGVKGYEVADADRQAAALTFVIDVSGSMAQNNRLEIVKEAFQVLVDRLRPDDTVAIVAYTNYAWELLPHTPASNRNEILNAIYSLRPLNSTNLEAGLIMGYQLANQGYKPGGINRVILASDGVANMGNTTVEGILSQTRRYADAGIYLTSIGVGLGNYNDVMLEQLANRGEGNYYYIDTIAEAETVFRENLTSTLQLIALDAKIQVAFDPQVVQQYRLLGYENRAIADSDFRNDEVDAAEFGAGHTAVAVYAVKLYPGVEGRIATVNLRWQDPDTRQVTEISGQFTTDRIAGSFDAAAPHLQLAILVSQFAELLRHSPYIGQLTLADLVIRTERLVGFLDGDVKVAAFMELVTRARAIAR